MATVVNVPPREQGIGGSFGQAAGGIGGFLVGLMLRRRNEERQKKQREEELKKASDIFTRAMSGEPQFVGPPSGPTVTTGGVPIPGTKPEFEQAPGAGDVLESFLKAGVSDPVALRASQDVTKAGEERRERQELESALGDLSESLPEGPGRDIVSQILKSRLAIERPGIATTLIQTLGGQKKGEKTDPQLKSAAKAKRAGVLEAEKEAGIPQKGGKPSETDKQISAVLQSRGLEATPENLANARIATKRADKVRRSLGARLRQDQETGLFKSARDNLVFQIAEGKVEDLLFTEDEKGVGQIASKARELAEDDLKSGAFLPEDLQIGTEGFGIVTVGRYLRDRFKLNGEDILDVMEEMSRGKFRFDRERNRKALADAGII